MIGAMAEAGKLKRWQWANGTNRPEPAAIELADHLGVHRLVGTLLANRGVGDAQQARPFLEPKLTQLDDPRALGGVDTAAKHIVAAVRANAPIVIYGDYDVDGITASAILWHTLTALGAQVSTYVPHRIDEGYGLNSDAIRQIAADMLAAASSDGARPLIISVDCGITAIEPAQAARAAGVDLIITDHHVFDSEALPEACALVHPALGLAEGAEASPLCGAGVALKLAWQVARVHCGSERLPASLRDLIMDLLSFAALGTVADVVPLIGENRVITAYGLGQIKRTRFVGLNAMIDAAQLRDEKIDAYHIGFVLGPRLNACGRMGHAEDAVRLLTVADEQEAQCCAAFLTQQNDRRRATERSIFDDAKQMVIDLGADQPQCRAIVLAKEGWHQGVVGIVASRLVDAFCRPVVMLAVEDGLARGSARSIDGVSIIKALEACQQHLTTFGGHDMAAGVKLPAANVDAFTAELIEYVNGLTSPEDLTPVLHVDATCALADVSLDVVAQLQRMAPFGRGNRAPILCVRGVRIAQRPRRVGRNGAHLKFTVTREGKFINAIGFGMGELAPQLPAGVELDVVFEPTINTWQGRSTAEMQAKDVKLT
jgi:single-stranded-DNA-specific exonuclease